MKNKNVQRLVAIMVISCITSSGIPVFAAPNDIVSTGIETTVDDEVGNKSIEKVIQNIQECDSKIEYKMGKLNELKEQILEKENQIQENEKQIELAQENIDKKDYELAERLNSIQKSGGIESTPMKYLEAILSSEDILDAIKKVHLISKICTSDKRLIEDAKNAKDNLTQIKKLSLIHI